MNILLYGDLPLSDGGRTDGGEIARHMWELAAALKKRAGYRVAILAKNSVINKPHEREGVPVVVLKPLMRKLFSRRVWLEYLGFYPDVIHFHGLSPMVFVLKHLFPESKRMATVYSSHEPALSGGKGKYWQSAFFLSLEMRSLDYVLFSAGFVRKKCEPLFKNRRVPSEVIAAPLEPQPFFIQNRREAKLNMGISPGRKILLFAGPLADKKGIDTILKSFAEMNEKNRSEFDFIFIGDGERKTAVERAGQVYFNLFLHGPKTRQELADYYNAADILVMPSPSEEWGFVYGEALLCGTPVIACDVEGVKEVLTDPQCCVLIEPSNPALLAGAILDLLRKETGREHCRNFALTLSWENHWKKYRDIYESLRQNKLS